MHMKKINLKNSPVINPKLSIILPVYNVERYLGQCLDSILALPLTEIEVICVNDGSLDNCGEILKSYAQKDSRVKVITQKNAGLSAARNAGLEQANGEFVLFIDSDDYILYEPFLELYSQIDKYPDTDLFVTDFQMVMTNDGHPIKKPVYQIGKDKAPMVGLDNLPNMLQKRQCFWNVWRNVYRRSFLEEHSLRFKVGYLCEDVDYTTKVYLAEPRAVFLHCPFYCYRVRRKDSLMGNVSPKRIRDTVELLSDSIFSIRFLCVFLQTGPDWTISVRISSNNGAVV